MDDEGGIISLTAKFRLSFVALAALLLGLTGLSSAFAENETSTNGPVDASASLTAAANVYQIVAMGDSISAGYEPGLTASSVPYGYVERLYEQALFHGRANAVNYGIIGLKVEGLNHLLEGAADHASLKAEDLQDFSMFEPHAAPAARGA